MHTKHHLLLLLLLFFFFFFSLFVFSSLCVSRNMISGQTYLRTIIIGPKSSSFSSWLCSRIPTPRRLFPGPPPFFINNNNNNNNNNNTRLFSLYPPAAQQEGKEIPQHDEQFRPPLHILFCGSDHFSATSLKALYQEHRHDPRTSVASIDVVCRRDKRVGRGLKTIREGGWGVIYIYTYIYI